MILHLYFARRFIMGFILISAVLFSLLVLVDMVDQARRFSNYDIGWLRLFGMTLLNTPETMNLILPLIMILATVVLFLSLARSSEPVSAQRVAGPDLGGVHCWRDGCGHVEPHRCGDRETIHSTQR